MNSSNEKNGQDQLRTSKKMNLHAQTCIFQENARGGGYIQSFPHKKTESIRSDVPGNHPFLPPLSP